MASRHDLVTAARSGNRDAFIGLVEIETPQAFRLCLRILRERYDAEDALQEAFIKAWRELPRLRDPELWPRWFRRIVVTSAISTARRRKASRFVPLDLEEPPSLDDGSAQLGEREELVAAMGHLDASDRALLVLRFGQDLELPDVAAALGIPLGTAKSRLHRALRRLRKQLENEDGSRESPSGGTAFRYGPVAAEPGLRGPSSRGTD